MKPDITLVECPRDAMQGWPKIIPTNQKVNYLEQLLKVGFHTLDCVSFVSPKAIPQMADSSEVLEKLDLSGTTSKLLAIVANTRGAQTAAAFEQITFIGYPFSISETFQQLNTNSSVASSFERVKEIQAICTKHGKTLVLYISMGFGNPYGDPYNEAVIAEWVEKLRREGIGIVSLADTVGLASSEQVQRVTASTIKAFPGLEVGVHLHSSGAGFAEKLDAALAAGCTRFDGALRGIGGCPMANNPLVGNMDSSLMIGHLQSKGYPIQINETALSIALEMAEQIFT